MHKILQLFKERLMFPVSLKKAKREDPPFEISNDGEESFKSVYRSFLQIKFDAQMRNN